MIGNIKESNDTRLIDDVLPMLKEDKSSAYLRGILLSATDSSRPQSIKPRPDSAFLFSSLPRSADVPPSSAGRS